MLLTNLLIAKLNTFNIRYIFLAPDEISRDNLMQAMRENGLTLKQSVLGRVVDNKAANQVCYEKYVKKVLYDVVCIIKSKWNIT